MNHSNDYQTECLFVYLAYIDAAREYEAAIPAAGRKRIPRVPFDVPAIPGEVPPEGFQLVPGTLIWRVPQTEVDKAIQGDATTALHSRTLAYAKQHGLTYTEALAHTSNPLKSVAVESPPGLKLDPDRTALHARIVAYADKHQVSFMDAAQALGA